MKILIMIKMFKEVQGIIQNNKVYSNWLNFGTEPYLINIGSNNVILKGTRFITHDASIGIALNYLNTNRIVKNEKYEVMGPIKIGNKNYISENCLFLPNAEIGDNNILLPGTVITKNMNVSGKILAGNPGSIIENVNIQELNKSIEKHKKPLMMKKISLDLIDKIKLRMTKY